MMAALVAAVSSKSMNFDLHKVPVPTQKQERRLFSNEEGRLVATGASYKNEIHEYHQKHKYMSEIYFGTGLNAANVTFDTSSPYLSVTSELCSNCKSESYHPGSSKTVKNLGLQW